jgi:hypothetical protein
LVELLVVVQVVAGSSPVAHPPEVDCLTVRRSEPRVGGERRADQRAYEAAASQDPLGDWAWFLDEFAHDDLELLERLSGESRVAAFEVRRGTCALEPPAKA